jgi:uncharacterized protein YcnI
MFKATKAHRVSIKTGRALLRGLVAAAVTVAGLVATSAPASAHATVQMYGETAKSGGYGAVFIRVPHALAGLNTTKVEVQIPEGVTAVKPQRVTGWTESTTLTEDGKNVATVIWDGGNLPNTSFADFGISVKFPATPDVTLYFKTVQTLNDGSTLAWIEIPAAGVNPHSLAKPAPGVKIAAAAAGHGSTTTEGHNGGNNGGHNGGHSGPAMTAPARWTGDVAITLTKRNARVVADTSAINAGKDVEVKVMTAAGAVTVAKGKLDSRGDLMRNIAKATKGKSGYTLKAGDKVMLVVAGTTMAEATI